MWSLHSLWAQRNETIRDESCSGSRRLSEYVALRNADRLPQNFRGMILACSAGSVKRICYRQNMGSSETYLGIIDGRSLDHAQMIDCCGYPVACKMIQPESQEDELDSP